MKTNRKGEQNMCVLLQRDVGLEFRGTSKCWWLLKKGTNGQCPQAKGRKEEARTEMQTLQHCAKLNNKGV